MGTDDIDLMKLKMTQEWKRMLKYRVVGSLKGEMDSQQLSNLPTSSMVSNNEMRKSRTSDVEEANETIPRMHLTTNNFLPMDFKSSKEISDILPDALRRYKQDIEVLNIENASLKKALQQIRAYSPSLASSPTKQSLRRSITSIKIGTLGSPSSYKQCNLSKGLPAELAG